MKIKIVHIIQSLETGGAEKLLVDLCLNYSQKFDVTVISQYAKCGYNYENILQENNVKIVYLNKKKGLDIKNIYHMTKALNRIKPQIIHTHLHACIYPIFYYIAHKSCVKVHTVHSIATMEIGKLHRIIQKFAYKFLNVTPVAICKKVSDTLEKEYNLTNINIIYNGINVEKYSVPHESSDIFTIINVASFSKWKNQILLLEAFKIAKEKRENMRLIFIGDGPEREYVKEKAKNLADVVFYGVLGNVEDYLAVADIFCLCSIFEGLPLSILEAYAAGLPVISTDVGGVSDILTNGENGFLLPINTENNETIKINEANETNEANEANETIKINEANEINKVNEYEKNSMAEKILLLYEDKKLRSKMADNNRKKAQNFRIEIITKKYEKLYLEKLSEKLGDINA